MKKNQPKINTSRRRLLHQTASAASLLVPPFVPVSGYSENNWQKSTAVFPEMEILNKDGTELYLKQFLRRPLLINFWATWCAPCVFELPHLDKAATLLKKFNIDVLLVSTDRSPIQDVSAFLDSKQIYVPFTGFDSKANWARAMNVSALPITFLINANQTRSVSHTGIAEWSSTKMINDIRAQISILG
jgi:thiol-disulfide isomerase/thioredoxin